MALGFTAAARKDLGDLTSSAPSGSDELEEGWRITIPDRLREMADAWSAPKAWDGMTQIGGVTLPGAAAGLVGLNELAVHGWDLAKATGQKSWADESALTALPEFLAQLSPPEARAGDDGLFGPVVTVTDDAPLLDRVVALAGRDPHWTP